MNPIDNSTSSSPLPNKSPKKNSSSSPEEAVVHAAAHKAIQSSSSSVPPLDPDDFEMVEKLHPFVAGEFEYLKGAYLYLKESSNGRKNDALESKLRDIPIPKIALMPFLDAPDVTAFRHNFKDTKGKMSGEYQFVKKVTIKELRDVQKALIPERNANLRLVSVLAHFRDLEEIDLSDISERELIEITGTLQKLKHLQKIKISCPFILNLNFLKSLPQIKEVELFNCVELTSLQGIEECKALTVLKLRGSTKITSLQGLKDCKALENLQIESGDNITSCEGLENCKALSTLRLFRCRGLTSLEGLENCAALTTLELDTCYWLLSFQGIEHCKALRTVKLNWLHSLTSLGDFRNCNSLNLFSMHNCHLVTSLQGLESCANLQAIDLQNCSLLSIQEAQIWDRVKTLTIKGTGLSTWELINLQRKHPALEIKGTSLLLSYGLGGIKKLFS